MAKKPESTDEINIVAMRQGAATFFIVGTSPLVLNRLSEKAKRELLLPRGRKNTAERASTLKHDPRAEFADSVYRWSGSQLEEKKTLLSFPGAPSSLPSPPVRSICRTFTARSSGGSFL